MMKKGDKAPPFKSKDQDGKDISLEDFKGRKLALFFYPKDNTPTCTVEACNLSDNYLALKKAGFEIVGVSNDTEKSHKKFISKYDLPFRLIADTDMKMVNDYGVWGEKTLFGRNYMGLIRTTFLIDEEGKIMKVIDKVNAKEHAAQILG